MLTINDKITIDSRYLRICFVRSGGPGGQNVNKVNTRAQLIFDLNHCPEIGPTIKGRLAQSAGRRLSTQGKIIIQSDRFREQNRNRQECLSRLRQLILKALIVPKKRRPTGPTAAAKRKRLTDKKYRSNVKVWRGKVSLDD